MWCMKCNNELSKCTCPDLKERLERIAKAPYLHIEKDYKERVEKQADRNKNEQTLTE